MSTTYRRNATAKITIGSRQRKSPFFDATVAAGVESFTSYNGMFMPTGFGDPTAEYERLTSTVALWDVAAERQVEIAGPDAFALTNYLSSRDLTGMAVNRARYAPMCDHQGRLINDPIVLRVAEDRYWLSLADSELLLWVRGIAGERGDDVVVFEPDVSPLALQGPLADEVASELFGTELVESLGFFHHYPVEIEGIPLVLCRSGWSKQGGFELFLTDGARGNDLWHIVMAAGEKYGIGPGTPNHQERIESGLLSFGSDHDRETDPVEAGLAVYTSLDKGHRFIGRDALIERMASPIRRNIVNVRIDGEPVACEHPWPASIDGLQIGMLRSAIWSTKLDTWLGLAQLSTPHDQPGTIFTVALPGGATTTATVHTEGFGVIQTR